MATSAIQVRGGFGYGEEPVQFVNLPDGRKISYREQGASKENAKRSLLVQHGLGSSRKAGIPGELKVCDICVDCARTDFNCAEGRALASAQMMFGCSVDAVVLPDYA